MSTLSDATAAIKAVWALYGPTSVPVFWHENTNPSLPDVATVPRWLHLAIEPNGDAPRAFGGGFRLNDRALFGSIAIRAFATYGEGEETVLDLLDDAIAAFRSRRSSDGNLSIISDIVFPAMQGMDGVWWRRSALVAFEYRYQG